MQHDNDVDFSRTDLRSLSPAEWTTLIAEISRRARIERDQVIRHGIARAWRGFWRILRRNVLPPSWISHVRKYRERKASALRSLAIRD
jgi:hypothetical protein